MSSLYVHIPFCNHICSYCDFCKVFYKEEWVDQYLEALAYEIQDKKLSKQYDTIYIGGGTPSSLSLVQLENLLEMLKPFSKQVKEYSIEINPESMTKDKVDLFKAYHINRVSIGVQTFHNDILKDIGRCHTVKQAIDIIEMLKENGIEDINVDLIYGLPHQTLEHIYQDIDLLVQLDISHISIYSLILEEHTFLKLNDYQPLDDEQDAYWYDCINDYLEKKGFYHYEVSNYYKMKPSIHNLIYWHYEDYDGIGLSAHSLKEHHRYENTNSLTKYLQCQYLKEDIVLEKEDELFEKIMMGLRLIEGIHIVQMNQIFQIDFMKKYQNVIEKYMKQGLLEIKDHHLRTTSLGMKYLNVILVDFMN